MGRFGKNPAPNLTSSARRVGLGAVFLAAAAVGCGGPAENAATVPPSFATAASVSAVSSTSAAPSTTAVTATTTTTTPTTSAALPVTEPEGTVIEATVEDGKIAGGARRETARLGEEVTIRVSGDSSDHVHIHGYDLFLHLTDGEGELVFTADIPGVFEVELEEAGVHIIQLEVS